MLEFMIANVFPTNVCPFLAVQKLYQVHFKWNGLLLRDSMFAFYFFWSRTVCVNRKNVSMISSSRRRNNRLPSFPNKVHKLCKFIGHQTGWHASECMSRWLFISSNNLALAAYCSCICTAPKIVHSCTLPSHLVSGGLWNGVGYRCFALRMTSTCCFAILVMKFLFATFFAQKDLCFRNERM